MPVLVHNPASVWYTGGTSVVSMDNNDEDNQYRKLAVHAPAFNRFTGAVAVPQVVGVFDPARIKSFDPLSRVPLGAYQPMVVGPASAASRTALGGHDLRPNQNLGGYVSQPVDLVTSLSALPALQNDGYYGAHLPVKDPISVIRVRVAGVTGPDPVSLERIREVAQQIAVRTHLDVDIVAGSSPSPTAISLPGGKFGQPRDRRRGADRAHRGHDRLPGCRDRLTARRRRQRAGPWRGLHRRRRDSRPGPARGGRCPSPSGPPSWQPFVLSAGASQPSGGWWSPKARSSACSAQPSGPAWAWQASLNLPGSIRLVSL
jgi:hypothetical protein